MLTPLIQRMERLLEAQGSLKWLVRAALVAAIVLPVLAVAVFSTEKTKRELTRATIARKQAVAVQTAATLKERFDRLVDVASSSAMNGAFVALAEQGRWQEAVASLHRLPVDVPAVERVFVADATGVLKADIPALGGVGQDFSRRDWFRGVTRDWTPYVSEIYQRKVEPRLNVFAVAVPVRSPSGPVHGVLVVQVRLETLAEWARLADGGSGSVYFIDRNGHVAGHPKFPAQGKIVNVTDILPVKKLFGDRRGVRVYKDRGLVAYEPVPAYGWGVVVQETAGAAFGPREAALRSILFFYGVMLLLTATLASFVLFAVESINGHRVRERTLLESVEDAIVAVDRDFRVTLWNRAAERLTGRRAAEVMGRPLRELVRFVAQGDGSERHTFLDEAVLAGRAAPRDETLAIAPRPGVPELPIAASAAPLFDAVGRVSGAVIVFQDIGERKRREEAQTRAEAELRRAHAELETRVGERTQELATANETLQQEIAERRSIEQQLLRNAFFDTLTGLPNRALFMERLGQSLRRSQRRKQYMFAVLFLDIDRFKVINDSLGHLAGDRLLVATAERLSALIRSVDTVARLGGDEFALLLDDIQGVSDATHVAERIQKEVVQPYTVDGQEIFITASIGIALSEKGYEKPDQLLRDADMAMYRAKSLGKARYEIFNMEMHARAMHQLQLEADLWRAIEHGEFRLYYQPVVSLKDGRFAGYETLVRWMHPRFGLLSPSAFISLAEDTGLIVQIGRWVLRTACEQNKAWQDAGLEPLEVSVNISARQFRQRDLAEMIGGLLRETGLEPARLNLEITESTVMENVRDSVRTLSQLKELGVRMAIDDFGTGYSSLGYLKRFPFDSLKIDQSFIRDVHTDPDNASITTAMITLGHSLKLKVVAEGVETPEQLRFLVGHGCDEMQGYLFSRPVPAEQFAHALRERPNLPLPNGA